jgi:hypothetical protein
MLSTRYSIVIANRSTGVVRRLTVSVRPLVAVAMLLVGLPALMVVGATRKSAWQRTALEAELASLRGENASIRAATGALTSQIGALQGVVNDL